MPPFFLFELFLEAKAEILENFSLVFWEIWRQQKDILQLTNLYKSELFQILLKHDACTYRAWYLS